MASAGADVNIKQEKRNLRCLIQEKLKGLTLKEKLGQTFVVSRMLLNHPSYQEAKRIAVYVSMTNEIGTYDVMKKALENGKQVFIPLTVGKNMKMVKLNTFEELKTMPKTKWNITQPAESDNREDCLETGGVELVVVPGVAFTETGLRLGHGMGYYDRFLAQNDQVTKSSCTTIAMALNEQIVDHVPTTTTDFQISHVLYPGPEYNAGLPSELPEPPEPFTI